MYDFFTKVKQMTGLDDINRQNDTPNMQELGNAMTKTIQKFAQCNQLENRNNFIFQRIEEIRKEGVNFQRCANESINQSDKLSKYAEEVAVFAVACSDSSFTKEELLDFLRTTLEDAKKNKTETENLKASFSGIMANLTNIQNECVQYRNEIQENARIMNSNVVNELEDKEFKQKVYDTAHKIGKKLAITGTAISIIAAPFTAGASLTIPLVESGLIVAGTTGAIALGSKFASKSYNNEINVLNEQLIMERDELNTQIGILNGNLNSIIHESCDILNFWDEQIASLKELLEKLEHYDQDEERPSRLATVTIQKKWNNVSRECKEYNRNMRTALQMSNVVTSD